MNAPILYPAGTTDFTSNGLGRLSDAISCRISEKENGLFELSMVYPVDGIHLPDITYSRIIYARHVDGPQPFEVYKISKPLNGKVEISAQHVTYGLAMIPAFPGTAASAAEAMALLESNTEAIIGAGSPFVFWTDMVSAADFTIEQPTSVRALLGGQEGSILDTYGGQYEWDHYTVKLHAQRGHDSGVTILYGKNLLDLTQEENIQNTYTGIAPFWSGFDSNQNPVLVTLPEKVRTSSNASNFPYHRIIPVDFSSKFESQPTEAQLRTAADAYISDNGIGVPAVSVQVSFVDLWKTEEYKDIAPVEKVRMCDIVTVKFDGLGVSASARVVETDWDVLLGRYNSVTVGDARSTLASSIRSSIDAVREDIAATKRETAAADAALQAAVDHATQMLTTGLGGYVVFKLNANGQPEELLVLGDADDYTQAQQVWRWNRNGLGYSGHGYNPQPPYGYAVALTADGQINADRITTGYLHATRIKGGTLTLGGVSNGNGTFDLLNASGNNIAHMDNTGATFNNASVTTQGTAGPSNNHTLKTTMDAGGLKFVVDGNTTLRLDPIWDASNSGSTGFGIYYPLYFVKGSGGNVVMRIAGYYGDNTGFNNGVFFGVPVRMSGSLVVDGDLTVNGTIHN